MIVDDYLRLLKQHQKEYGNVYLLYMVGAFYEAYARTPDEHRALSKACEKVNLSVVEMKHERKQTKKQKAKSSVYYMAGFHKTALLKYKALLLKHGYTVVRYDQDDDPSKSDKKIRKLVCTYSRSTSIDACSTDTNWLLTIHIERVPMGERRYAHGIGLCLMDVTRGTEVLTHERHINHHSNESLEELRDIVHMYAPQETLIIAEGVPTEYVQHLQSWLGINKGVHVLNVQDLPDTVTRASLRDATLRRVYRYKIGDRCPLTAFGLVRYPRACLALVQSLHFVESHNPLLLDQISVPKPYNSGRYLNTHYIVERLKIMDQGDKHPLGSVYGIFASRIMTAMGRRYLKERLSHPRIKDKDIEGFYEEIEAFRQIKPKSKSRKKAASTPALVALQNRLNLVADIDRMYRRMHLRALSPGSLKNLYESHIHFIEFLDKLPKQVFDAFNIPDDLTTKLSEWNEKVASTFILDNMARVSLVCMDVQIFREGQEQSLDELTIQKQALLAWLNSLANSFSSIIDKNVPGMVKLERTDKDGYYLKVTKRRFKKLETANVKIELDSGGHGILTSVVELKDFNIDKSKSNHVRLRGGVLTKVSDRLQSLDQAYKAECRRAYLDTVGNMWSTHVDSFRESVNLVGRLDVALAAADISLRYNYCRPTLHDDTCEQTEGSYVKVKELRHPISERVNTDVNFMSYTLELGCSGTYGMVLTSPNGSGKSVLLKSLGVSIYMAQCGLYVPATTFTYRPYHHLACRAGHFDDLLERESTYTMEMKELQRILQATSKHSLLLLDEIAASTEHISAFSIQVALMDALCKRNASFIFATHVKHLEERPEIMALGTQLQFYHMRTQYDRESRRFIYEYNLKPGVEENRQYGLEVLSGIVEDADLKALAFRVRDDLTGRKSLKDTKVSRYNSKLATLECAICGDPGSNEPLDTHHIAEQCTAVKGLVKKSTYVHARSNLVTLCKKHHRAVHGKGPPPHYRIEGYRQSSDGSRHLVWEVLKPS